MLDLKHMESVAQVLDHCNGVRGYTNYHCVEMIQNSNSLFPRRLSFHTTSGPRKNQLISIVLSTSMQHMIPLWNYILTKDEERTTLNVFY